MREQMENRMESLRAEYRAGQEMLAEMEGRQASLKITLTRISGAIQVLEELLQGNDSEAELTKLAESAETRVAT
jgi:predicted nuclease with TOPRIM domain